VPQTRPGRVRRKPLRQAAHLAAEAPAGPFSPQGECERITVGEQGIPKHRLYRSKQPSQAPIKRPRQIGAASVKMGAGFLGARSVTPAQRAEAACAGRAPRTWRRHGLKPAADWPSDLSQWRGPDAHSRVLRPVRSSSVPGGLSKWHTRRTRGEIAFRSRSGAVRLSHWILAASSETDTRLRRDPDAACRGRAGRLCECRALSSIAPTSEFRLIHPSCLLALPSEAAQRRPDIAKLPNVRCGGERLLSAWVRSAPCVFYIPNVTFRNGRIRGHAFPIC